MVEILQYPFIQNAFLAGSFIAIAAALLGYLLVIRGLTFAGHALSNIGFAGAAGAVLIGVHPVYGLLGFTVAASLGIGVIGRELRERDVAIGVVMTFTMGLGVLFLSLYHGYAEQAYSILFGTILGINRTDVYITGGFCTVIITSILVMWRPLLFSSFDPEMAEASGVPLKILGLLFLVIVALTVSVAMQVVGVLLVFALLVGPSATAARIIHRPGLTVSLAILLGLVYTWLGILLAAKSNWPVSFYIAGISFLVYLPVRLFVHAGIRPKSNFPRSLLTHSDQEISENMVSANDDLAKLEDMDD